MSLVGTRPPTVDEWEKYELHHRARLAAKPGLTGMWQVSGRSNITDFEEVVELDREYISHWSMGLDFRILLKTIQVRKNTCLATGKTFYYCSHGCLLSLLSYKVGVGKKRKKKTLLDSPDYGNYVDCFLGRLLSCN